MTHETKQYWRLGVRDKKNYNVWQWSREYESFEELMQNAMPYLKSHIGAVTKIITRTVYVPITGA